MRGAWKIGWVGWVGSETFRALNTEAFPKNENFVIHSDCIRDPSLVHPMCTYIDVIARLLFYYTSHFSAVC